MNPWGCDPAIDAMGCFLNHTWEDNVEFFLPATVIIVIWIIVELIDDHRKK